MILQSQDKDKDQWTILGPIVNTLQTYFTYGTNPCDNALYDPSCPGYAGTITTTI